MPEPGNGTAHSNLWLHAGFLIRIRIQWPSGLGTVFGILIRIQVLKRKRNSNTGSMDNKKKTSMHVFGKYFPPHLRVVLPVDRSHRRRVLSQEPWLQKKQTIREVASMIDMQATVCMCIFYLMNMC